MAAKRKRSVMERFFVSDPRFWNRGHGPLPLPSRHDPDTEAVASTWRGSSARALVQRAEPRREHGRIRLLRGVQGFRGADVGLHGGELRAAAVALQLRERVLRGGA